LVGVIIAYLVIRFGQVRNKTLALIFGILGGLIALYLHWAVWADLAVNAGRTIGSSHIGITISNIKIIQVFHLVLDPATLWSLVKEINIDGVWSLKGSPVSGIFLSIIWVIEAVVVIGAATFFGYMQAATPFCEVNKEWFDETTIPATTYIQDPKDLVSKLESGEANVFETLTKTEDTKDDHSIFKIHSLPSSTENYLTIENKKAKTNSKGEIEFTNSTLVEYILINDRLVSVLKAL
jgi:hypothetical protein